MAELGYEIKYGKHIAFKPTDKARFTRAKTIGEDYTEESLKERCLFLRKCTVVPEERIPLFRSKYTVRPEQDTACIILASASLLA